VKVRWPYSYLVELDGTRSHVHANKLRKFYVRIDKVVLEPSVKDLLPDQTVSVETFAVIYEHDLDFGPVNVVDSAIQRPNRSSELPPSQKIDPAKLAHLSALQREELLSVLDASPDCFSDTPGFCDFVEHEISVTSDFKPKRIRAYKIPKLLKPEVQRQIHDLLSLSFIRPSKSQMSSPLVCVLKGKDGKDGVPLAVDYRCVNKYTVGDAYPIPNYADVI